MIIVTIDKLKLMVNAEATCCVMYGTIPFRLELSINLSRALSRDEMRQNSKQIRITSCEEAMIDDAGDLSATRWRASLMSRTENASAARLPDIK
jgi:hypothetical protein